MWVDYRGPLSTVHNDGEISTFTKSLPNDCWEEGGLMYVGEGLG